MKHQTPSQGEEIESTGHNVAVIVLGDVGRSPRMQYHARSLLQNKCQVTLIGYDGEDLIPDLTSYLDTPTSPPLKVIRFSPNAISSFPPALFKIPILGKIIYYVVRLTSLVGGLYHALWTQMDTVPDCILIQNPPSIPLLLLCLLYCHSHYSKSKKHRPGLVIDWHNLGYTMFGCSSNRHPIYVLAKLYEQTLGPYADAHLCVTQAMKDFLIQQRFIRPSTLTNTESADIQQQNVHVLHDKPPEFFHKCNPKEIHEVISRYKDDFKDCFQNNPHQQPQQEHTYVDENNTPINIIEQTLFTVKLAKTNKNSNDDIDMNDSYDYRMRKNRPALLVSSTSWTPDEDFSILLSALLQLEEMIKDTIRNEGQHNQGNNFPKIVVAVTGKGPQKQYYQKRIQSLNPTLSYISIHTLWLTSSDYPLFIGSADLGISLHTSTSGIDLPMKVLDMMGCHVPVCAISFQCVGELVVDGKNGKVFQNETELAATLFRLFGEDGEWRDGKGALSTWRDGIGKMTRWKENWDSEAKNLIFAACSMDNKGNPMWWFMNGAIFMLSWVVIFVGFYLR